MAAVRSSHSSSSNGCTSGRVKWRGTTMPCVLRPGRGLAFPLPVPILARPESCLLIMLTSDVVRCGQTSHHVAPFLVPGPHTSTDRGQISTHAPELHTSVRSVSFTLPQAVPPVKHFPSFSYHSL